MAATISWRRKWQLSNSKRGGKKMRALWRGARVSLFLKNLERASSRLL